MSLIPQQKEIHLYDVDLSNCETKLIESFLQGAVYTFCNKFEKQEFMLKDLVGERNFFGQGTPLFILYKKCNNKDNPYF